MNYTNDDNKPLAAVIDIETGEHLRDLFAGDKIVQGK